MSPGNGTAGVNVRNAVGIRYTEHDWWNAGTTPLQTTGWILPADNAEYFLSALFESRKRSGGGRPGLFDIAFLTSRYRSEFAMIGVPAIVTSLVFPVLATIGRLLGKYLRFADAPEPVYGSTTVVA